jgi:hypothetical protein
MDTAVNLIVALIGALALTALTIWLVTVTVGAGFQTLGMDGPGWQTVAWFTFAAQLAMTPANSMNK